MNFKHLERGTKKIEFISTWSEVFQDHIETAGQVDWSRCCEVDNEVLIQLHNLHTPLQPFHFLSTKCHTKLHGDSFGVTQNTIRQL